MKRVPSPYLRLGAVILVGLALGSCKTVASMAVPKPGPIPPATAETARNSLFHNKDEQAKFALMKVIAKLRRGQVIGHFPTGYSVVESSGPWCLTSKTQSRSLEWGTGSAELGNWSTDLGEVFFETMSQRGFDVAGNPRNLFGRTEEVISAEYHVGAVIEDIAGNFCETHNDWDGTPLGSYSGEMWVKVAWVFYDALAQREVGEIVTEGYHRQVEAKHQGILLTLHGAFADATERLAVDEKFVGLIHKSEESEQVVGAVDDGVMTFSPQEPYRGPIDKNIREIIPSVVTMLGGLSHGSGFVIDRKGLILTNQHVVGTAKRITVRFSNGIETEGHVLRRHKARDVALVKVPIRVQTPLPIASKPVGILDKVYAVGTPRDKDYHSTVTGGVVSALRKSKRTGMELIQADVPISGGNSGGPLLDARGNVVGISVSKVVADHVEGLGFFVPIEDALQYLNLAAAEDGA